MSDTSDSARDDGASAALGGNSEWLVCLVNQFMTEFKVGETVTGEDIRMRLTPNCGLPRHPNGWGASMLAMASQGLIEDTGRMVTPKSRASHSRQIKVWTVSRP